MITEEQLDNLHFTFEDNNYYLKKVSRDNYSIYHSDGKLHSGNYTSFRILRQFNELKTCTLTNHELWLK